MAINVDLPASEAMDPAKGDAKGDGPLFPEIRTVPLLHGQVVEGEEKENGAGG